MTMLCALPQNKNDGKTHKIIVGRTRQLPGYLQRRLICRRLSPFAQKR